MGHLVGARLLVEDCALCLGDLNALHREPLLELEHLGLRLLAARLVGAQVRHHLRHLPVHLG